MDFFAETPQFTTLSLLDLLHARDQFHPHLINKANVVGTAVGRYRIRKGEPWPDASTSTMPAARAADHADTTPAPKPARTLENSEVRDYSWPCVLVFVSRWVNEDQFGPESGVSAADFVPKTIYMPDGRRVPVCVVHAPPVDAPPPPVSFKQLPFPDVKISGGYAAVTDSIQGVTHYASIGCLVTDGHTIYALTNRHVAGREGESLHTYLGGNKILLGKTSDKQIGRLPFERVYPDWPGRQIYVNVDVGLITIGDQNDWSPGIFGVGPLGPLADLSIYNLTLNLIGCSVRAHGAASGRLFGEIAALFYRYKSQGGFEYVADFLIGPRDSAIPLTTRPGDSGTVWVVESDQVEHDLAPIAVQWGGAVFAAADATAMPFALASNLSAICRELNVDLVRATSGDSFEYWGAVGHYTIGALACNQVKNASLKALMLANRDRVSFDPGTITKSKANNVKVTTKVNGQIVVNFVQLADVPDKVWKKPRTDQAKYGRRGPENPNHYADIDLKLNGGKSLDDLTPTVSSLKAKTWRDYYDGIGFTQIRERGLLPFRVWQIYKKMVEFVTAGEVGNFVAAAGTLAHYVGDACQPLHGSYLDDGDPFRNPDGSAASTMLQHSHGYAAGVHMSYEDDMLDDHVDKLLTDLGNAMGPNHGMTLITGGQAAGFATIELMRRARKKVKPIDVVNAYGKLNLGGTPNAAQRHAAAEALWKKFRKGTVNVMADGSRTLAMLWDSAWAEGSGNNIAASELVEFSPSQLRSIYEPQTFLKSVDLNHIDNEL